MKKLLIDTDIGPDCDDAAALAMANIYENQGLCEILGIGHCTSNPYGAGAIDVICRFYGHPDMAIGTYYGESFLAEECHMLYNRALTTRFDNRYRIQKPEEAVSMYRRILACQEDKSVEFVAIGPLNNLARLLASGPDVYSGLSGEELVERKVSRLVCMGGVFQPSADHIGLFEEMVRREGIDQEQNTIETFREFNIVCDIPAARKVAHNWHTPKVFLGWEAGLIYTGIPEDADISENHPVKIAYDLFWTENGKRLSWDLLTMEFAVVNDCAHYECSPAGIIDFDEKGHTVWKKDVAGNDYYVKWAQPGSKIAEDIEWLLCK